MVQCSVWGSVPLPLLKEEQCVPHIMRRKCHISLAKRTTHARATLCSVPKFSCFCLEALPDRNTQAEPHRLCQMLPCVRASMSAAHTLPPFWDRIYSIQDALLSTSLLLVHVALCGSLWAFML